MGNGICARRHKRIFQFLVLLTVIFGLMYGAMVCYEMHKQLKRTEAIAAKYQQHQESLSAQLQVVYEHRSRLEKSLQKERLEHKKAKEDFLVYKLEAQQSLNKDKQDSTSRFNSLNVQHEMLKLDQARRGGRKKERTKELCSVRALEFQCFDTSECKENQHDELKKRYYGLHEEHQLLREDHNRALTEHKDKYDNLQQEKEIEISKLKENIYNLHEENKLIRKAHQDVHTQLQDVKKQHTDLKFEHDQLAMTLDDHKSALAAAQAQVEEFKQFKETLKKMPSFRQPGLHTPVPEEPKLGRQGEDEEENDETQYKIHKGGQQPVGNVDGLRQQPEAPNVREERGERNNTHPSKYAVPRVENRDRRWEGLQVQPVEEDHRMELAEEEMEQAGQPEHLDEESDQPQEEEEKEGHQKEEQHHQPPAHAEQEEAGTIHKEDKNEAAKEHGGSQQRLKSAYEEQLDQQRLVARREEEARQLKERQDSLHRQRLREQMDRQQQLRERELQMQREADHKEQILRRRQQQQQLRQQQENENIDADIVDEEQDVKKQNDGHEHPHVEEERHKQQDEDPEDEHAKEDANPQEDPNNQGEDEFEEAEKEKHSNIPDGNAEHKKHLENMAKPDVHEQLVMAGNPDQQEDTLDEQYQEEGEEEVHDDMVEGPKVQEEEKEAAYNKENEKHGNIKDPEGPEEEEDSPPGDHLKQESEVIEEENYEEEVEEEKAPGNPNRRAEM
ncbi:Golgi integral membrane protein 4-like isoform X2 [Polyodon spathula]|nr:Golgi integral membrane protein 4-like isoform X2 [Polyodon spathula]